MLTKPSKSTLSLDLAFDDPRETPLHKLQRTKSALSASSEEKLKSKESKAQFASQRLATVLKSSINSEWGDDDPIDPDWSHRRQLVGSIIRSQLFDCILGIVLIIQMVLVVLETDATAKDKDPPWWLNSASNALLGYYATEICLRIYVTRAAFFCKMSNLIDIGIVFADIFFEVFESFIQMPSLSILRMFRLVRLGRAIRVLILFPELHLILMGLAGAAKAIMWGTVLIAIILTFWGILAVKLIHPINEDLARMDTYVGCDRCPFAFSSVSHAVLTFFQQIIAGDSWGQVSVPIIEHSPWSVFFFVGVLVSVNLAIMNLILAVIVENAQEAKSNDQHLLATIKQKQYDSTAQQLYRMCEEMDADKSGRLNYDELVHGFETNAGFIDMMKVMDIKKTDLEVVFKILDDDDSGDVDYTEFIENLHKMKSHDGHTLLVFIKFYVTEIRQKVQEQLRVLKGEIFSHIDHAVQFESNSNAGDNKSPQLSVSIIPSVSCKESQQLQTNSVNSTAHPAPRTIASLLQASQEQEPKASDVCHPVRSIAYEEELRRLKEVTDSLAPVMKEALSEHSKSVIASITEILPVALGNVKDVASRAPPSSHFARANGDSGGTAGSAPRGTFAPSLRHDIATGAAPPQNHLPQNSSSTSAGVAACCITSQKAPPDQVLPPPVP